MIIQEEMQGSLYFWYWMLKRSCMLKTECVILQLKYGRAINFAVGRPDWNPAFALVQMTVYRGKTAVLTIRVFAKVKQVLPPLPP